MQRLVIAIDCDDVLINASEYTMNTYNQRFGTAVRLAHVHQSGNKEWEADRDEVFRRLFNIQADPAFGSIVPRKDAIEAIPLLTTNYELHLITSRPDALTEVTQRMVDTFFNGYFTRIDHVGRITQKEISAKKLVPA